MNKKTDVKMRKTQEMRKTQGQQRIFLDQWQWLLAYGVVVIISVLSIASMVLRYRAEGINIMFLATGLFFAAIALALFVRLLYRNKDKPAIVFLLLGIPAVCTFALLYPPEQIPDEIWHAYRILDIGAAGTRDMTVPAVLAYNVLPTNYETFYQALAAPADYGSTTVVIRHLEQYLNHLYLIPGIVAAGAQFLHVNPFIVILMARATNACLFVCAGYWALKMLPFGKTVLLIYLLNPVLIQQEASCSADAFVNAVAILFIAYLLKLKFQEKISHLEGAGLIVLGILMALSKFAYAPLLLLFLLFAPRIEHKKKRNMIYAAVAVCVALGTVFVLFVYGGTTYRGAIELIKTPRECVGVIANTFQLYSPFWAESFFGGLLGNLNIYIWDPCWWFYAALLVSALFNSHGEKLDFKRSEKAFIVMLVLVIMLMIVLAFREWSIEVYDMYDTITGAQGRYFLPIFILLLLALLNKKQMLIRPHSLMVYSCCLIAVLLISSISVVIYFI